MKTHFGYDSFNLKIGLIIVIVAIFFAYSTSYAQFRTKFTNIYFEGLAKPNIQSTTNYSTNQYGAGINVCAGGKVLNMVLEYNYNWIEINNNTANTKATINFSELYLGLRYYPIRPTFLVGKTAIRFTAGYLYGFDMEPNWRSLVTAGFAFSSIQNTSGVSVNFVYRPETFPIKGYRFEPSYAVRFAIVMGPKAN